jgi:GrpB-like predicted nucleotidyltransferase (UPF0157 family)
MTTNDARRIYLVPYNPAWPKLAARLAGEILKACGPAGAGAITSVEHIGSTSIPGCAGKPLIDLMPALVRYEAGLDCVEPLGALGYEYRGEFGLPRRHYFTRYSAASSVGLTEHLHMYTPGEGQWDDQLAFRDYLRAHDEARDEYVALKRVLAERHPFDGQAYADDKSEFVQRILRLEREEAGDAGTSR